MRSLYDGSSPPELTENNSIGFFTWCAFFCILGLDFLLNAYQLLTQSIRLDEAQSIWAATKPVSGILSYLSLDVAAPLYAVLLHFWIQVLGPDIIYARILSLIFFLMTLPVLYILAKESSNKKVALLTVTLFSLSPFIMWYTSEARMYTLFTFITGLNHLFFLRVLKSDGKKEVGKYLITLILGLYTHYFFVFLLITQAVYLLSLWFIDFLSDDDKEGRVTDIIWRHREVPLRIGKIMILAFYFFAPWLIFVMSRGGASGTQPLIARPTTFNIFQAFVNFLFGFQANGMQSVLVAFWPLAVIVLFFVFTQKRRTMLSNVGYFVMATFFPVFIDFVGSYVRPIFLSRYLILITPSLFFILAWVLINNSRKVSSYLIAIVICVMFGLMTYQNVSAATPVKEDYKGVSDYLESNARKDDIILVSAPFTIYPIEYTYHGVNRIDTVPLWDPYEQGSIPEYSRADLDSQVKKYTKQYSHLFVVLSYDQGYQKDIVQYLDKNYKRNAWKKFSPGLEIREYQLRY